MLLHNLLSSIPRTCHYLLITNCFYRVTDQANRVETIITDKLLEEHLLVLQLDQCKVALNAIEIWTVWDVEDWSDLKSLECLLGVLSLMDLQVVHEDCEWFSIELLRELFQKLNEALSVNGLQVA
jgi:hypothetical protein